MNELAFFRGLSDDPGSGLAEVLGGRCLLRYLRWTALQFAFQVISLPLCFIGFCTFRESGEARTEGGNRVWWLST